MEPKFQTSFIPKSPITTQSNMTAPVSRGHNIFSVIGTVVFLITLVAAAGVFVYKDVLTGEIASDSAQLNTAQASFQPDTIQQLVDANSRITAVKDLLAQHTAVSGLLALLQNLTLKNVQFDDLNYVGATANVGPTLTMDATAATYNALAEQEQVFTQNASIQSPQFSDFVLGDNGAIKANFFADLDPSLVSYANALASSGGSQ